MLDIAQMQQINNERKGRWHAGGNREWSTLEWAGAMCGEAGEAANVAKKILRIELSLPGNQVSEHPITDYGRLLNELGKEIADVILYASLLASHLGIELETEIRQKFNSKSIEQGFPERL